MSPAVGKTYEIIVIGASAGGIGVLNTVLGGLKSDFAVPIAVVLHIPPDRPSQLAELFGGKLALPVREPEDKEAILPGHIYFAPPGYHLLVEEGRTFCLNLDDPVNFSIPSVDSLFESVSIAYGPAALGIVLTGANDDGARGLAQIVRAGGAALVQAPDTAPATAMPLAALKWVPTAQALSPVQIAELLQGVRLSGN